MELSREEIRSALAGQMKHCELCPHQCGADRSNGGTGVCGALDKPEVYQHFIHMGEEVCIIPAFIINLAHCSMHCPTCPERFRWRTPMISVGSPSHYAQALVRHFEHHTMPVSIEWIGGEPSVQIAFVIETSWVLKDMLGSACPKILLNTNGYFSRHLFDWMAGAIDGYVFDLKAVKRCSRQLCGVRDYWETVTENILEASKRASAACFPNIIRHLVMPGHTECCTKPIIDWCHEHVPEMTFNLMTAFRDFSAMRDGGGQLPRTDAETSVAYARQAHLNHLLIDGNLIEENES